jgi:chromosome segregation ATPase
MTVRDDNGISDELTEKVFAFIDREAGRDAPLSPEDEAMVEELLEKDPTATALADEFREVEAGLEALFEAGADVRVSDDLIALIQARGSAQREDEEATDNVVTLRRGTAGSNRQFTPLAAAASLAFLIAGGAFLYSFQARQVLERTVAELKQDRAVLEDRNETLQATNAELDGQLATANEAIRATETALAAARSDIGRLEMELSTTVAASNEAQADLASASERLAVLQETRAELEQRMATLETESDQAASEANSQRIELQGQLAELQTELEAARETERTAQTRLTEAAGRIDELESEGAALERKVTALESVTDALSNDVAARERQLEVAETTLARVERQAAELAVEKAFLNSVVDNRTQEIEANRQALADLEQRADELAAERQALTADVAQGQEALTTAEVELASVRQQSEAFQTGLELLRQQTGWLAQVAGYHIGYAGKPREVEVSAKEQADSQALTKWLSNELGRPITIPRNLPMRGGLTFVGGRVLPTLDGISVGQIAYHDSQDRLTAFCLKRNPTGQVQKLQRRQFFGRLQMIHWQDEDFQYVVVGFADFAGLEPAAAWLKDNYWQES